MFRLAFVFLILISGLHASPVTKRAAIVGAGITGLTAGILLKKQGWEVKIYEKRASLEHIGGGLSIWPNGARILLDLPCGYQIPQLKGNLRFEKWADAESRTVMKIDRDLLEERLGAPFMNICRSELQQLLFRAFGEEDVVFNADCREFVDGEAEVSLHFKDGSVAHADLLIAADGVHSKVRKALFPEAHLDYTGFIALVGIFKFPPGEGADNHLIWTKDRYFLDFDVADGRQMVYATRPLPKGELRAHFQTKEEQIGLLKGWSHEVDYILDLLQEAQRDPEYAQHYFINENVEMEPLLSWHRGRVVLLGDAAHPMGSLFGFNANLGLEDAQELSQQLDAAETLESALTHLEEVQIPRTQRFYDLELWKKRLFMQGTEEDHAALRETLKTATFDELFGPVFKAMDR